MSLGRLCQTVALSRCKGWKSYCRVSSRALPIHLLKHFYCSMYCLATIAVGCIVRPQCATKNWTAKISASGIAMGSMDMCDTDCILTFSLGLSVLTLRRFCHLRSTTWYMYDKIWYDPMWQVTETEFHEELYTNFYRIPEFWQAWWQTWSWRVVISWNCWAGRRRPAVDTVVGSACARQNSRECSANWRNESTHSEHDV